ncbi:MAG TPA: addiction module protein [Pyrinomonadaceae bacterium]|nr:addiction module protein [Pyrinomonadaceae bacterium]
MSHILEEALKLPDAERLKLTDDLYESVERPDDKVSLTPAQMDELHKS